MDKSVELGLWPRSKDSKSEARVLAGLCRDEWFGKRKEDNELLNSGEQRYGREVVQTGFPASGAKGGLVLWNILPSL